MALPDHPGLLNTVWLLAYLTLSATYSESFTSLDNITSFCVTLFTTANGIVYVQNKY